MSVATKTCFRCKEPKPLSDFSVDNRRIDRRHHACRECDSAKRRAAYLDRKLLEPEKPARPAITEKKCSKCSKILPLNEFGPDGRFFSGRRSECRACARERRKLMPDIWQDNQRKRARAWMRASVQDLSDDYIRRLLSRDCELKKEDVPESLIKVKRLQIRILRKAKEMTDEKC